MIFGKWLALWFSVNRTLTTAADRLQPYWDDIRATTRTELIRSTPPYFFLEL
jgi:hypothetical protein